MITPYGHLVRERRKSLGMDFRMLSVQELGDGLTYGRTILILQM